MSSLELPSQDRLNRFFGQYGVVLAYLFGSYARQTAAARSDVDIAVLLGAEIPPSEHGRVRLQLTNALMDLLRQNRVDVVLLDQATPLLARQVLLYGCCLYAADELVQARFAVETLRRYEDTRNLRRIRRYYLERRLGLGRRGSAS